MPRIASFDLSSIANALGYFRSTDCLTKRQGRCQDPRLCADCAWGEDATQRR